MPPRDIEQSDWNLVHEAAINAANAPDDDSIDHARRQMRDLLGALKMKYVEHPTLLATEADYVDDPDVAIGLLLQAYDKVVAKGEVDEVVSIALSLAEHYAEGKKDVNRARHWLSVATAAADGDLSAYELELETIASAVARIAPDGCE